LKLIGWSEGCVFFSLSFKDPEQPHTRNLNPQRNFIHAKILQADTTLGSVWNGASTNFCTDQSWIRVGCKAQAQIGRLQMNSTAPNDQANSNMPWHLQCFITNHVWITLAYSWLLVCRHLLALRASTSDGFCLNLAAMGETGCQVGSCDERA